MIKKPDGTFMIVSDMEANELKKRGKLIQEIPKAKGGKLTDYTQKPILVLKE